ncbi:hypothetical protein LTR02_009871 [Friedmanniomyces endolithicus]|nr:hypothetical protein LTR94_013035 [Friedmanniomyces endolithicus]KAK0818726.1 hypothetical protein LTR38_000824 [Friedmanniomyces endolithicus]KAK0838541.1 hypothetical protein LTR03_011905 [Friedmanniomyces endolithicus]KAK0855485.1 hypothetical protein LTS02_011027 [Friedmanniomyces endolithicus]KAK0898993.1 hypothetical protein LTR02_009871 [Friedmanniomyces endolithicus]
MAAKIATSPPAPHHYSSPSTALAAKTPSSHAPQNMAASYFASTPRLATPQQSTAKSPSPNYFGFQAQDSSTFQTDAPQHAKQNWSPPSSAVRSTAAASPTVVPVDQDPRFDAFRRQSEGKAFNLGGLGGDFKMDAPPSMPKLSKSNSKAGEKHGLKPGSQTREMPPASHRRLGSVETVDAASAELMRSPKRVLSPGSAAQPVPVRKGSPAHFNPQGEERPQSAQSAPRFKLPLDDISGAKAFAMMQRSETLPESNPSESDQYFVAPQRVVTLLQSHPDDVLILDLRVSTHYAKSHLMSALNLCIPTTLLKRPSYNVQKLAETFKDDAQKSRFENWRNSSYIIVYDAASAHLKDAQICMNMIKKFRSDGYEGALHIVKGGFTEFSKAFAQYVEAGVDAILSQLPGAGSLRLGVAPVIGGCPMPLTDKPANPFFGNIRQNMDLIGGVGQIPVKHPQKETTDGDYPDWLRKAADDRDQGQRVSTKFEAIERREKKRMEDALSGKVSYGSSTSAASRPPQIRKDSSVQIAGLEKGAKNRYNNIWPFEHSRVRLQGVPMTGCDYFNANFIKATWSNKRYISTQAPIPGTFDDFWNVVWQQDIRVIVMLTAEKEGAQVKAHNYWDQKQYGSINLDFLSEKRASLDMARIQAHQKKRPAPTKRVSSRANQPKVPLATLDTKEDPHASDQPYVIVRKFTLSHDRHPFEPMREITQLQYSAWPDFGAPAHPAHLLGLVEQTDAVVRSLSQSHGGGDPVPAENERPVMVHCSAGCGRTGTFCTVDSVIDMLKRQRVARVRRGKRAGTPMEVDEQLSVSAAKEGQGQGPRILQEVGKGRRGSGGGGDFFRSQYQDDVHEAEGIDGPWVEAEDVDLVEKTVEDFRRQRLSMVQSLRQFVLCYESVMEWLAEQGPVGEGCGSSA